jgi:hypothetical protein
MENRVSSLFALVRGCRDSSGLREFALACCATLILFCQVANAQTATGQFNGHVYDQSGAAVAGATVKVEDPATGWTRTVQSSGEGLYLLPLIPPGKYQITVTQAGFQAAVSQGLQLNVNQISTQDFHLQVGAPSQVVNVSASETELLQATSTELGTVVQQRTVSDLPLNGRSFTALLTLAPGANPVNQSQNGGVGYSATFGSAGIPGSTYTFPSVQGQWNRENLWYIDGIINGSAMGGSYDVPPIIDTIQEFKVQSHNDQSEYGGVLGGVVNLVTKSGTNTYHGSGWDYLRNNVLDARNPFTDFTNNFPSAPATFRQNEFGGAFGGPVRIPHLYNGTNKTYFYVSYEGWRYAKAAGATYVSPTEAELNGDFTNASVVTSTGAPALLFNPYTTTGTAGNFTRQLLGGDGLHVPQALIDPVAQAFLKNYSDKPNFTPATVGGNNTILNSVGTDNANGFSGRVDQNFGSKDSLWFRYSFLNGANVVPKSHILNTISSADNRNAGGGWTHVFSPTFILDARGGWCGRYNNKNVRQPINPAPTGYGGVESTYGFVEFDFAAVLGGGGAYNFMGGNGPNILSTNATNFAANITWIRGKHQLRFGFENHIPEWTQGLTKGGSFGGAQFQFSPTETADPQNASSTGNPLAAALMGIPDSGRFQSESNAFRVIMPSAYIQDTWKVTPRLTISAGFRWDGESSPHLEKGNAANLDPNTGNWEIAAGPGKGGQLPPPCDAANGIFAPCIPSSTPANDLTIQQHVIAAPNPNLGPDPYYKMFQPRIGAAFKLTDSMVIRGGWGLVYDALEGNLQSPRDRLESWPSNASLPLNFNVIGQPLQTMTTIVPTLSSTNALPAVPTPWQQFGWYYDPHIRPPYSQQFNVEIQKQFSNSLVASVAYVGSVTRHLPITGLANDSPVPGEAGANRPFPWAGTAIMATDRGTANYNSMQAKVEKRVVSGLAFGAGWTWSKSLDNGASGFYDVENGPGGFATVQNYNDLSQNYGTSGNSLTHIVYGWAIYELPFGKGKPFLNRGIASAVLGGWQTNANLSAHSGIPLTFPDAGIDPANIGNTSGFVNYGRANLIGDPRLSHPTFKEAFNTAAFAHPVNQYGDSGRGIIASTPYSNFDFSLMKNVPIAERLHMQFRAEFFNVFNIQNYGLPGTTFGGGNFGVVSGLVSGATPRQIQFSLRVEF